MNHADLRQKKTFYKYAPLSSEPVNFFYFYIKYILEFETASFDGSLVLLPHLGLVLLVRHLAVIDVVQPQVHTERYGAQALVEDLRAKSGLGRAARLAYGKNALRGGVNSRSLRLGVILYPLATGGDRYCHTVFLS